MGTMTSQITNLTIVYSTVCSGADQRKHQSSAPLAFMWGIHRGPVNSPHKWPVTRKMFPFDDVIMKFRKRFCAIASSCNNSQNDGWRARVLFFLGWRNRHVWKVYSVIRMYYRKTSNISRIKSQNLNVSCIPCSCLRSIHWSQVLSWEWRCSWSSADRRCSNYIWVINNFIAYWGAIYIRGLWYFSDWMDMPTFVFLSSRGESGFFYHTTTHTDFNSSKISTLTHLLQGDSALILNL